MKIADIDKLIKNLSSTDFHTTSLRLAAANLCDLVADELEKQNSHQSPIDNNVPNATK